MKRPSFFYAAVAEAPAGSSGGTAVAETITPDTGFDPSTYEAPDVGDIDRFIDSEGRGDAPLGKNAAAKPVEKKADEKPVVEKPADEKKPEEKKPDQQKEPPAAQLRNRLKELEAERDALNTKLEAAKSDKRVEELTAKLAEKEAAIAEKEKAVEAVQRRLEAHNPLVSKKLTAMSDKFNAEFQQVTEIVPDLSASYRGLVDEFESLPRGKEGYSEKLREFREQLREAYGDDAGLVFEAVRKGVAFRGEYAQAADAIQKDAAGAIFGEQREQWQKSFDAVNQKYDQWFTPPVDAEANDPYNHNLFLKKFEEAMPADEVAKINANIKAYTARVFNGPQPRSKTDFPGMDDAAIQKAMGEIETKAKAEREDAQRIFAVGAKLITYFRPLIAEWQKAKSRAGERSDGAPPDPTRKGGQRPASETSVDDFTMPSPEDIEQAIARA